MSFTENFAKQRELIHGLRTLIQNLIDETSKVKEEIVILKEEIGILKIEIGEIKENMKPKDKKVDKERIDKGKIRMGKKYVEKKESYETGSMDDRFRKIILPIILEDIKEKEQIEEIVTEVKDE